MTDRITRQHSETDIPELVGYPLEKIIALKGEAKNSAALFYLFIKGMWFKVFLDNAVLFFDDCDGPDHEDDLEEGEEYLDIANYHHLDGEIVSAASMKNGVFCIGFKSGTELVFEEVGKEVLLRVIK